MTTSVQALERTISQLDQNPLELPPNIGIMWDVYLTDLGDAGDSGAISELYSVEKDTEGDFVLTLVAVSDTNAEPHTLDIPKDVDRLPQQKLSTQQLHSIVARETALFESDSTLIADLSAAGFQHEPTSLTDVFTAPASAPTMKY